MPEANDEQAALDRRAAKLQALMALQKQSAAFNPKTDDPQNLLGQAPGTQPTPAPQMGQTATNPQPQAQAAAPEAQPQFSDALADILKRKNQDDQLKDLFPNSGK